jgi:hypothetical protein
MSGSSASASASIGSERERTNRTQGWPISYGSCPRAAYRDGIIARGLSTTIPHKRLLVNNPGCVVSRSCPPRRRRQQQGCCQTFVSQIQASNSHVRATPFRIDTVNIAPEPPTAVLGRRSETLATRGAGGRASDREDGTNYRLLRTARIATLPLPRLQNRESDTTEHEDSRQAS